MSGEEGTDMPHADSGTRSAWCRLFALRDRDKSVRVTREDVGVCAPPRRAGGRGVG